MLLTEYDYDTDIAVQREEAFEEGLSQGIEQGINQGISQGIEQGIEQKALETAKKMLENGISLEIITQCTGLSLEKLEDLISN